MAESSHDEGALAFLEKHPVFTVGMLLAFYPLKADWIRRMRPYLDYWTLTLLWNNPNLELDYASLKAIIPGGRISRWIDPVSLPWETDPDFFRLQDLSDEELCARMLNPGERISAETLREWFQDPIAQREKGEVLNFQHLSYAIDFAWSRDWLELYEDKWDWSMLSLQPGIPFDALLLNTFAHRWVWTALAGNHRLHWKKEWFDQFRDKLPLRALSWNEGGFWTRDLLEANLKQWNWVGLAANKGVNWDEEMLSAFTPHWHPGAGNPVAIVDALSHNQGVKWTEELLEKYKDVWNWANLSENEGLPWNESLIRTHETRWNWQNLSQNNGLPWTLELIEQFLTRWDLSQVARNQQVFEDVFAPEMSPEWIESWIQNTFRNDGAWYTDFNALY